MTDRLAGMAVIALGAWRHSPTLIGAGAIATLLAWTRGLLTGR